MKGELDERDQLYADLEALEHENKDLQSQLKEEREEKKNLLLRFMESVYFKYDLFDETSNEDNVNEFLTSKQTK